MRNPVIAANSIFACCFILIAGPNGAAHAQAPSDSARGWVNIITRQPGLAVFIDGREAGATPLQNFAVAPGPHDFAVRRSLSASWLDADWSARLIVPAGDTIDIAPEFLIGYTISSTPARAQVWMEGRYLGATPYILRLRDDAGARLTLALPNYQSAYLEIKPENGGQAQRQFHLALTPVPSSLSSQSYASDLSSARHRQRKWGYIAGGISVVAGISAVMFKQQADEAYEAYLVTGEPGAREQYYARAQEYDRYFSVAFGVSQVSFVFSIYSFLKSIR